ncbi:aldo/keto reductase [bacterium]|nr:aldo/keto reductase [bacterium]
MRYINKELFTENLLLPDTKKRALLYLRGYNNLKKSSNIEFVGSIKNKLGRSTISNKPIKQIYHTPKEICLHQFICHRRLSVDFTKELLISINNPKKEIKYGLPKNWRNLLSNEGFKLSIISNINWTVYKFKWLLVGLYFGFKEIKRFFKNKNFPQKKYIHSIGITRNNLSKEENLNNFFNWLKKQNEVEEYGFFTHTCIHKQHIIGKDKKITFVDNDLPPLPNFRMLLKFTFWLFYNTIKGLALNDEVLIFYEKVKEKLVLYSEKKSLAKKYFFNHQYAMFRPLIQIEKLCKENSINKLDLCLAYVCNNSFVDYIIIGVQNKAQLNQVIQSKIKLSKALMKEISAIQINQKKMLNPTQW